MYNLLPDVVSKNCWMTGKQCRPDEMLHFVASHLGIHCLLRPVHLNTYGKYSKLDGFSAIFNKEIPSEKRSYYVCFISKIAKIS